jgi:hypothetical protein
MRRLSACLFTHVPHAACRLGATAIMIAAIANSVEGAMCVSASVQAPARTSPALIRNLQVEVASIWKPYDVDIEWNTRDRCALDVASVAVIIERGHSSPAVNAPALGLTRVRMGALVAVPVHLDYDAARTVTGTLTSGQLVAAIGRPDVGEVELGRALGRVLAHEIGHLLLAAPNHQRHGLMREAFSALDLVALHRRSYTLSEVEMSRLDSRWRVLMQLTKTSLVASSLAPDCLGDPFDIDMSVESLEYAGAIDVSLPPPGTPAAR